METNMNYLAVGNTFESNTWRIHRYRDSLRITSLLGAGKRGKRCEVFGVYDLDYMEADTCGTVVEEVLKAGKAAVSVEAMRNLVNSFALLNDCKVGERSERGVDVRPAG